MKGRTFTPKSSLATILLAVNALNMGLLHVVNRLSPKIEAFVVILLKAEYGMNHFDYCV